MAYKSSVFSPSPRRIAWLLALVTLGLYLPVARFGFCVYDDSLYVTENPTVQNGLTWTGLKWAFTTMAAANWHPVTWISHMLDCTLFGLNPAGPHLINALLHAVNAALLFTLLFRLTQKLWPAAFIAALFAWHPMHVESVAWIAERKDVLSTFFALLAFLAYARYAQARRENLPHAWRDYVWCLLAFALALMAKPMLVTFPCVLLLLDFWPLQRIKFPQINWPVLLEKIPLFLITAGSCLITMFAQSRPGSNAVVSLATASLKYRLKDAAVSYVEYLCKVFWPSKLAIFYPLQDHIFMSQAIAAMLTLLAVSFVVLKLYRQRTYLFTGWFWFLGMLVPVIGLVQVGSAQIADRYSYLPSIGIFIAVTFLALDLAARWRVSTVVLGGTAVAILVTSVGAMEIQLHYWRSNIALFEHSLAVTRDNDIARNDLGVALQAQDQLAEAIDQYRRATELEPTRYQGHHNLACALDLQGHPAEALAEHRKAVEMDPSLSFLHTWFAVSLAGADETEEALEQFTAAIKLDPHDPWPRLENAKLLLKMGRDDEAVEALRSALKILPDNLDLLTYTAQVLATSENAKIRDGKTAFILAAKANLLADGSRVWILDVLGMACAEMGKFDDAQMAAQEALKLGAAQKLDGLQPIAHRLELYEEHQPWRTSFQATNAPASK